MQGILDFIQNVIYNTDFIHLMMFFLITVINQLIATLRSIFTAKKVGLANYITVGIDAFLYTFLLKSLTDQTYYTVILYIIGKILGTIIADKVEDRIALGIYNIELYVKDHETQKELQDILLEKGYSSTMGIGTITDNKVRWYLDIQIKRKDMQSLYDILDEYGLENPTMIITEAKQFTGKIKEHI